MFDLVSTGIASYGVATKLIQLINAGHDTATIIAILAGIFGGIGALGVLTIEIVKRMLWRQGAKEVIMW
ncbi:uberolysin/carnocyclin family circular bacteriocin [Carboxydocella sp. ULO1]|uniref:uberolysin/carnocyclin family circular bacteriocin n=1 Tax=Carboxydocella sp. ULO1 TaxID=1926599 RepID=UPI0009AE3E6C|nr:uberolysin/carnocyclin family circular bacteriocin [Carboxydocella sp. ULO1]GAW27889.1 hypothetical protein ULO1_04590 [Carboxydocella sp. ULO1]